MTTSKSLGQIAFESYFMDRGLPCPSWREQDTMVRSWWDHIAAPQKWITGVDSDIPKQVPTSVPSMMRRVTNDPTDSRLTHGSDSEPTEQAEVYLVLSEDERAQGFVRPLRRSYVHGTCGAVTTMGFDIAATYARNPEFYGSTYCTKCRMHRPVSEFTWDGTDEVVGS